MLLVPVDFIVVFNKIICCSFNLFFCLIFPSRDWEYHTIKTSTTRRDSHPSSFHFELQLLHLFSPFSPFTSPRIMLYFYAISAHFWCSDNFVTVPTVVSGPWNNRRGEEYDEWGDSGGEKNDFKEERKTPLRNFRPSGMSDDESSSD
jgi:hypothetical protein